MLALAISFKDFTLNLSINSSVITLIPIAMAQLVNRQVSDRKVSDSQFDFRTVSLCPWERHFTLISIQSGSSSLPVVVVNKLTGSGPNPARNQKKSSLPVVVAAGL